jgi:hypothetical protein
MMIYLLTAIGLTPSGSSTVHIYTQTIHRTTQLTNWEECGLCPIFASYTLAIAFTTEKKAWKNLSQWQWSSGSHWYSENGAATHNSQLLIQILSLYFTLQYGFGVNLCHIQHSRAHACNISNQDKGIIFCMHHLCLFSPEYCWHFLLGCN